MFIYLKVIGAILKSTLAGEVAFIGTFEASVAAEFLTRANRSDLLLQVFPPIPTTDRSGFLEVRQQIKEDELKEERGDQFDEPVFTFEKAVSDEIAWILLNESLKRSISLVTMAKRKYMGKRIISYSEEKQTINTLLSQ